MTRGMFECPVHGLVPDNETMSGLPGPYGAATLHWAEGNHCGKPLHWITAEVAQAVIAECVLPESPEHQPDDEARGTGGQDG